MLTWQLSFSLIILWMLVVEVKAIFNLALELKTTNKKDNDMLAALYQ